MSNANLRDLQLVDGYTSVLTLRETQKAIKLVKDTFAKELSAALNLERVSAPFIVKKGSGINDDLNGVERKVEFDIKEIEGTAEIVPPAHDALWGAAQMAYEQT